MVNITQTAFQELSHAIKNCVRKIHYLRTTSTIIYIISHIFNLIVTRLLNLIKRRFQNIEMYIVYCDIV